MAGSRDRSVERVRPAKAEQDTRDCAAGSGRAERTARLRRRGSCSAVAAPRRPQAAWGSARCRQRPRSRRRVGRSGWSRQRGPTRPRRGSRASGRSGRSDRRAHLVARLPGRSRGKLRGQPRGRRPRMSTSIRSRARRGNPPRQPCRRRDCGRRGSAPQRRRTPRRLGRSHMLKPRRDNRLRVRSMSSTRGTRGSVGGSNPQPPCRSARARGGSTRGERDARPRR